MSCSECGHPIGEHYPNFKGGLPVSFYCGLGGAVGGCRCVRPAEEVVYRRDGERFVAESETTSRRPWFAPNPWPEILVLAFIVAVVGLVVGGTIWRAVA